MKWLALVVLAGCAHHTPLDLGDHRASDVAYHVIGHGPVCVVIPGGPGLGWQYLRMPQLEKTVGLVYVEPIGTGASARLPAGEPYRFEHYADQIEQLRRILDIDKLCLIGHSHGGDIALRYAIDHPDRVRRLVLYSAPSRGGAEFAQALAASLDAWKNHGWFLSAKAAMLAPDPKTDAEAKRLWTAAVPLLFADWDAHLDNYAAAVDVPVSAAPGLVEVPPTDFRPLLGKITAKTLVIVGAHDFCCGAEPWGKELASGIAGASLVTFPHSGHMAHLEEPDQFAQVVADFVR